MTLGQHLREKRKAITLPYGKKVSLDDLASIIPCSKSYLWELEHDRCVPSLLLAKKIATVYRTTLNKMAEGYPK